MKTGIIIGSSPINNERTIFHNLIKDRDATYIIAADGGIDFLIKEKICPDIFLGDMDSCQNHMKVRDIFPNLTIEKVSPIKDDTDMELGIKEAIRNECQDIVIFGGLGGKRLSHTLGNMNLLPAYTEINRKITFIGENIEAYALIEGQQRAFAKENKKYISVFSVHTASYIEIKGLKYEFTGLMPVQGTLGVSNETCGQDGFIKVNKGKVIIIEEEK